MALTVYRCHHRDGGGADALLCELDERHPALTAHLRDTLFTGATCRYAPNGPIPWRL